MDDQRFLAGMWQKAAMLQQAEAEQAEARRRSRAATRQMYKRILLCSAAALALLVLCCLALLYTKNTAFTAMVPAVYLPFSLALFWDGRLFSEQVSQKTSNGKGVSTR